MTQSTDILSKFGSLLQEADAPVQVDVPFEVRDNITHKLTFHKGRAKNFRSIGNQFMEIDYQRNPATLVTSDDNGAGKSTMLVWLLFFVLYNDTYSKKEKKAGLVNSQSRKECVGEVEFSCRGSEWKVRRGIKPDFVEVYQMVDGKWMQIENDAAKGDMNKYIVNLIGVDQKMFENSLVLGKEKFIPFTEMYTADRRAMVETIWDLGFFSLMNDDVKAAIKKANTTLDSISNECALKVVDHTNKKTQLNQIVQSNALIQQQSADILVQQQEALTALNADIAAQNEELTRLRGEEYEASQEMKTVEGRLHDESLVEIEEVKKDFEAKIKTLRDDAQAKADDYELIEVSAAERDLQVLRDRAFTLAESKNALVTERNANLDSLNAAIQRRQQGENFRIKFQTEMEGHQTAIKRFHDMGTCPTCTQEVTADTKAAVESAGNILIADAQAKLDQLDKVTSEVSTLIDDHKAQDDKLAADIAVIDGQLDEMRKEADGIVEAIKQLRRDIQGFHDVAEVQCSSLNRQCQDKILDIRKALNTRFEDITASLQKTREQASRGIVAVNDKIAELNARRAPLVASIADLERKLAVQPTPTTDLENAISSLEGELEALYQRREDSDDELQDLQHLLFFLKDDQTKARIIALYLPFLNSKINEYLEALNMFLDIVVDDTFEITMSAAGRKGQSIFSLSTGQRSRLNLAVTLALRDVANLKASVQCNLFVLDEILENMSERGVQESVEMLKHKFGGNNLFVISQREQEFQEYFQHNIRYGLRNGLTEVIKKD